MHAMWMIFNTAAIIDAFPLPRRPARSGILRPRSDLRDICAPESRPPLSRQAEPYGILTPGRPIRNRKLTRVNAKSLSSKESIMLDVAFVVLGLAVLALMGAYAVALRQL
jgi:hypothetical protein